MKHDEIVALATAMRAAGVSKFRFENLECELLPAGPTALTEIAERIGELSAEERLKLLKQAKEDFERDLYGSPQ